MIKVTWKIGKKPRGYWRPPLDFQIAAEQSEALSCRPKLVFDREYELPGIVFAGSNPALHGENACKEINKIRINVNTFLSSPITLAITPKIFTGCSCPGCRLCLEWRPGKPDYGDFETLFRQIASDLIEAWNEAVEEAASSEEYEGEEVIITPDTPDTILRKRKEEEKISAKPCRKVKIA